MHAELAANCPAIRHCVVHTAEHPILVRDGHSQWVSGYSLKQNDIAVVCSTLHTYNISPQEYKVDTGELQPDFSPHHLKLISLSKRRVYQPPVLLISSWHPCKQLQVRCISFKGFQQNKYDIKKWKTAHSGRTRKSIVVPNFEAVLKLWPMHRTETETVKQISHNKQCLVIIWQPHQSLGYPAMSQSSCSYHWVILEKMVVITWCLYKHIREIPTGMALIGTAANGAGLAC